MEFYFPISIFCILIRKKIHLNHFSKKLKNLHKRKGAFQKLYDSLHHILHNDTSYNL